MDQTGYYATTLKHMTGALAHETKVISGLKKALKQLQDDDFKPLDSLEEVIADREYKRDFMKRSIKKLEDAMGLNK
jgi:bacterioferritin (cytochrome b1)